MLRRWRGLRLVRRVVRPWRWFSRRRSENHLRLESAPLISPSHRRGPNPASITKILFDWGRRCLPCRAATREKGRLPLLEEQDGGAPPPPPKGHLVVYVGDWKDGGGPPPRRYVVPLVYFHHPLFGELLREAEKEFGFDHPGGITIPCPVARFERVQTRIAASGRRPAHLGRHRL